jgi:hypothetical protein
LLTIQKRDRNYAPHFNEFASININLDEIEAMNFYNLGEINKNPNIKPSTLTYMHIMKPYPLWMHMNPSIMKWNLI